MQTIQCQRQTSIISMVISWFVISFDWQLQRLILIRYEPAKKPTWRLIDIEQAAVFKLFCHTELLTTGWDIKIVCIQIEQKNEEVWRFKSIEMLGRHTKNAMSVMVFCFIRWFGSFGWALIRNHILNKISFFEITLKYL